METVGVEPDIFLVASEALVRLSYIPLIEREVRTGGVEPPQHEATGLQPAELAVLSVRMRRVADRIRTGTARLTTSGADRYTTATTKRSGDDRTRTGDLSPDKRVLCAAELRPRTGWRGWDSNPRSRAHEAREDSRSSTARRCEQVWPAGVEPAVSGSRNRRGGHAPLQPEDDQRVPPAGLEPAASGLRARRHRHFDHGGVKHSSGGRDRTCASRVTVARLTTRPHRNERNGGSRIRTCERLRGRLRASNALP